MEGGAGAVGKLARSNQGNSSSLQHFWLRAAAGQGEGGLKQDTVGFLFRLLLFHWRFPIYLSDQVIEDIKNIDL